MYTSTQRFLETRIKTAFIGALAAIENGFGHLWGDKQTPEQQRWWDIYQEVRTNILNNGNTQLRALQAEVSQKTIKV